MEVRVSNPSTHGVSRIFIPSGCVTCLLRAGSPCNPAVHLKRDRLGQAVEEVSEAQQHRQARQRPPRGPRHQQPLQRRHPGGRPHRPSRGGADRRGPPGPNATQCEGGTLGIGPKNDRVGSEHRMGRSSRAVPGGRPQMVQLCRWTVARTGSPDPGTKDGKTANEPQSANYAKRIYFWGPQSVEAGLDNFAKHGPTGHFDACSPGKALETQRTPILTVKELKEYQRPWQFLKRNNSHPQVILWAPNVN